MFRNFILLAGCFISIRSFSQNDPTKILAEAQRKLDSVMKNNPAIKKYGDKNNPNNVVNIPTLPTDVSTANLFAKKPDTAFLSKIKMPKRDEKALSLIPKQTLTSSQLSAFIFNLKNEIIPNLQKYYHTERFNISTIGSTGLSNAASLAWCAQRADAALDIALEAADKNISDINALNNLSGILTMCGAPLAAIPILDYIKQTDPDNSTINNNLGQAYIALGDIQKGSTYLKQALVQSPFHPNANYTLACISYAQGDRAAAQKYCEDALRGGYFPEIWTMLQSINKKARLMDLIRHRYKQPDYFNPHKYPLPLQCKTTDELGQRKTEYEMFKNMLRSVKDDYTKKLKTEEDYIRKNLAKDIMKKVQEKKPPLRPFSAFGLVVLGDISEDYTDKILKLAAYDSLYQQRINALDTSYEVEKKQVIASFQDRADKAGEGNPDVQLEADMCKAQNELANRYLPQFAELNESRQREWIEQTKNYFIDYAYWCYIAAIDIHSYRQMFYQLVIEYITMLEKIGTTRLIGCAKVYNTDEKDKAFEFEEQKCPFDNKELPLPNFDVKHEKLEGFIGKLTLDCDKLGFEFGEGLILNLETNIETGETTIAFGPGVSKSIPIVHLLELGAKMQFYMTLFGPEALDIGVKYEVELDLKGSNKPEEKAGWILGINSRGSHLDLFADGPIFKGLSEKFEKLLFPPKPEIQMNKNVKLYND